MTLREMWKYWWTGEHTDYEEGRRKINILLAATYILTREALVSEIAGKPDETRALRSASHEIDKLIGRMEATRLQQE